MRLGDRSVVRVSALLYCCVRFRLLLRCLPSPLVDELSCVPLLPVRKSPKVHGIICLPNASLAWFALCLYPPSVMLEINSIVPPIVPCYTRLASAVLKGNGSLPISLRSRQVIYSPTQYVCPVAPVQPAAE